MGAILGSPSHPLHLPRALIRAAQAWRDQHWWLSSVQYAVMASSEVMLSLAHMTRHRVREGFPQGPMWLNCQSMSPVPRSLWLLPLLKAALSQLQHNSS